MRKMDPDPYMYFIHNYNTEKIYLYRTCLNEKCDAEVIPETIKPVKVGAGLRLHGECRVGHKTTWSSCEFFNQGRSSVTDVKISTLQLLTGLCMSKVNYQ